MQRFKIRMFNLNPFALYSLNRIIQNMPLTTVWLTTVQEMWSHSTRREMEMWSRVSDLSGLFTDWDYIFIYRSVLSGWARWLHSHCGLHGGLHSRLQCRGDQVGTHCARPGGGGQSHCGPQARLDPLRAAGGEARGSSGSCSSGGSLPGALWWVKNNFWDRI